MEDHSFEKFQHQMAVMASTGQSFRALHNTTLANTNVTLVQNARRLTSENLGKVNERSVYTCSKAIDGKLISNAVWSMA